MRTKNLLEKGLESRDASIFHHSAEDLDKLITEHEAASQIVNEHRTLHFFLLVLYTIVVFGVNAHFMLVLGDYKSESLACLIFSPPSYVFLLLFGLCSVAASLLAIRRSTRKLMDAAFFRRQRLLCGAMLLCSGLMGVGLLLGDRPCRKPKTASRWCVAWAALTATQALLLRSYSAWVDRELTHLSLLAESGKHAAADAGPSPRRTPDASFEVPSIGLRTRQSSQDKEMEIGNLSLNSITTV
jgi:hypothetical protein